MVKKRKNTGKQKADQDNFAQVYQTNFSDYEKLALITLLSYAFASEGMNAARKSQHNAVRNNQFIALYNVKIKDCTVDFIKTISPGFDSFYLDLREIKTLRLNDLILPDDEQLHRLRHNVGVECFIKILNTHVNEEWFHFEKLNNNYYNVYPTPSFIDAFKNKKEHVKESLSKSYNDLFYISVEHAVTYSLVMAAEKEHKYIISTILGHLSATAKDEKPKNFFARNDKQLCAINFRCEDTNKELIFFTYHGNTVMVARTEKYKEIVNQLLESYRKILLKYLKQTLDANNLTASLTRANDQLLEKIKTCTKQFFAKTLLDASAYETEIQQNMEHAINLIEGANITLVQVAGLLAREVGATKIEKLTGFTKHAEDIIDASQKFLEDAINFKAAKYTHEEALAKECQLPAYYSVSIDLATPLGGISRPIYIYSEAADVTQMYKSFIDATEIINKTKEKFRLLRLSIETYIESNPAKSNEQHNGSNNADEQTIARLNALNAQITKANEEAKQKRNTYRQSCTDATLFRAYPGQTLAVTQGDNHALFFYGALKINPDKPAEGFIRVDCAQNNTPMFLFFNNTTLNATKGYDENLFKSDRITFEGSSAVRLKPLHPPHAEATCKVVGTQSEVYNVAASYELKNKSTERIICAKVKSDVNSPRQAILFLGLEYLPEGLHRNGANRDLITSFANRAMELDFPKECLVTSKKQTQSNT